MGINKIEVYLIEEYEEDDLDATDGLIRIERVSLFDENNIEITDSDELKENNNFYYWDFHSGTELVDAISKRLCVNPNIIEIM